MLTKDICIQLDPIRDVQVLCPMNRGSLGVRELNQRLQRVLNPARMQPPMARLTLARKIAAIALKIWKKGERFDPAKLKQQAA